MGLSNYDLGVGLNAKTLSRNVYQRSIKRKRMFGQIESVNDVM